MMRRMTPAEAPTPPGWRWRRVLGAPHRIAFCAGAALLAAGGLWWAAAMLAFGLPATAWRWAVSPGTAHALLLGWGAIPFYFAGFLCTTAPKWLAAPPLPARALLVPVAAALAGWALVFAGVHGARIVAAAGTALVAAGHGGVVLLLARLLRASAAPDRLHAQTAIAGYAVCVAALAAAAIALGIGLDAAALTALVAGLWGGIGIVFAAALHRLVPFFGAVALPPLDARWPAWLLWTMLGALAFEAAATIAAALGDATPPLLAVRAAIEAVFATLLLGLAVRWAFVQNLRLRLIAMLHLGLVWLGIAFALAAASHALAAAGAADLGAAPLHALGAGCYGSVLLAMATRVSAALSGRTIAADDVTWRLFALLQAAVLARVGAALWPGAARWLLPLAALLWVAATATWAVRCIGWYGRPRIDGRPG